MRNVLYTVRKFWLIAALVGVMGMSLAACGGDNASGGSTAVPTSGDAGRNTAVPATAGTSDAVPTTSSGSTPGSNMGMKEYQVKLIDFAIDPKTLEVPAGKVMFIVTNEGSTLHNLVIESLDARTPNFMKSDGPKNLEVELAAGTYKWLCDIPGHAARGMTGELTVK